MKKRIAQKSHYFLAVFRQVNPRLLWIFIILCSMPITVSAHFGNNSCLHANALSTNDIGLYFDSPPQQEIAYPSVILFIEPIADICLSANNGLETLVVTIQGGDGTGVGVWSGSGFVPPNYFDPTLANLGPNVITYTFVENGFIYIEEITINVYFSPTASFSATSLICANQFATISAPPVNGSIYDWNFNGGNIISGNSAGPYEIGWTAEGTYPVTLTVTDINGCTSTTITKMVTVVAPLSPPLIDCNTDTSMIEFSWDDVDGALGYTINVLAGTPGIQTGNTYTVSPLNTFDAVTIELTFLGTAPCGDISVTQTCYATDCSTIRIRLDAIPDFCLTDHLPPFALNANVINNTNGTGVWSGNGIIDTISGLFDPNDSSVDYGTNTITYTFTEQDCSFTETMSINVLQIPEIRLATPADLNCNTTAVELNANGSKTSPDIIIAWLGPTGGLTGPLDELLTTAVLPGTYTLTLTDALTGCKNDTSFSVRQIDDSPVANANIPDDLDCHTVEVEINGFNSTGAGALTFEWTYDETLISQHSSINVAGQGTYILVVTDAINKCSDTTYVDVFESPHSLNGADLSIREPSCHGENDVIISIDEVFGGIPPYKYTLNSISFDNTNFMAGLGEGEYTFTVVDQENCSWDTTFTVYDPP
ncbi:MAG: PKD repeat protein, partial [Saprospiraceae bacterium]